MKSLLLDSNREPPYAEAVLPSKHIRELCINANVEAHAYMCDHAADSSRTRESMPAVCSSSTSVVLKTGYSHVLCMAPYISKRACWYGCGGGGGVGTVQHVGFL